jgi:hypothetical protein
VKVGDLVRSTGFGPEGTTGAIGLIVKPSLLFPRTWIVHWSRGYATTYAQDGLEVINESR